MSRSDQHVEERPPDGQGSTRPATNVEHRELLSRLGREYEGRATPEAVVSAVLDAERMMASARIDTFVPILVERHAREALRREAP